MPDSMSEEAALLADIGFAVNVNTGASVAQSVLYGFFVALILYGFRVQRQRYGHSTSGRMLLSVMLVLFTVSTAYFLLGIYMTVRISNDFLVYHPELPLLDKVTLPDLTIQNLEVVAAAINAVSFFLADGVVVWRARVICEKQRHLIFIPLVLLFGMAACSCVFIVLMALYPTHESVGPYTDHVQTAVWSLSLATNVFSTGMIAFKIWQHRAFERSFYLTRRQTPSEKILVLLVDSGIAYCIVQIVYLTVHLQTSKSRNWAVAASLVLVICTQLSAIYPTLILVLVALRYSLADDDVNPDPELSTHIPGPIQFSSTTTNNTAGQTTTATTLDITTTAGTISKTAAGSMDSAGGGDAEKVVDSESEKCRT